MGPKERKGALLVGLCACAALVLLIPAGCAARTGTEPLTVSSGDDHGVAVATTDAPEEPSVASSNRSDSQASQEECGTEGWEALGPEIRSAFEDAAQALKGLTVYIPTCLPADARLAEASQVGTRARAVVAVESEGGVLEFQQVIQGDMGDLPAERVDLADGRRASVYRVLGGILVQWAEGDKWYGVYATGFSREKVLQVAEVCVPRQESR